MAEGAGVPSPFASSSSDDFTLRTSVPLTTSQRFHVWRQEIGGDDPALVYLLDKIVSGDSLNALCEGNDWSYTTVRRWLKADAAREAAYDLAREDRADFQVDQMAAIAQRDCTTPIVDAKGTLLGTRVDPGKVAQAKLEVDTLKWTASKMNRRYADRVDVNAQVDLKNVSNDSLVAQLSAFGLGAVAASVLAGNHVELPGAG